MAATAELRLTFEPMGNSLKKISLELLAQLDQTLVSQFLDCPLSELYMVTCSIKFHLTNGLKVNFIWQQYER